MRKSTIINWVAAAICVLATNASAEVVVIVNPNNSAASLTAEQVAALFLGTANAFPDGTAATLADQLESASARNHFYEKATGRSVAQVKATWARIVFTGKGTPPKELKSDADVKAFVAQNAKAIGYIDSSSLDGTVKAVLKL